MTKNLNHLLTRRVTHIPLQVPTAVHWLVAVHVVAAAPDNVYPALQYTVRTVPVVPCVFTVPPWIWVLLMPPFEGAFKGSHGLPSMNIR